MARKGVNPRVVISRASDKKKLAIVLVVVALTIWGLTRRDGYPGDKTSQREVSVDFDFYLLALTLHPAFCADGHGRKPECRAGRSVPISIHGLWPENLAPGRYPRDCSGPALELAPALERDLSALMPGMADGLHEHEWLRHGTCSGLDDDEYFRHTLTLARRVDSALRRHLTTLAGATTGPAALREQADRASPGLGATLTFHCRTLRDAPRDKRGEPFLVEIRQCVDDDGEGGAPLTPIACATVQRRDQGCGREFHVAGAAAP
jgi:ribonuclease T2